MQEELHKPSIPPLPLERAAVEGDQTATDRLITGLVGTPTPDDGSRLAIIQREPRASGDGQEIRL